MLLHEQPDRTVGQHPAPLFVSVPPEYAQHTKPYGSDSRKSGESLPPLLEHAKGIC